MALDFSSGLLFLLLLVNFFLLAPGFSLLVALKEKKRGIRGQPGQISLAKLICILAAAIPAENWEVFGVFAIVIHEK